MTEILKELASVFQLVSSIPVTGDAIDTMAAARNKLRKIYADVEKQQALIEAESHSESENTNE